jgi:hypothetical protein
VPLFVFIYRQKQAEPPKPLPRLHICTMASYTGEGLTQLLTSCQVRNLHLDVLGLDQPFSFGKKLRDVKDYVETIPDEEIVLFTDAFDTLILADEETIVKKFQSMNVPFIISAETNSHPFIHVSPYYPPSPTKFKYLNSGCYIGYAGYLKKLFEEISPIPDETDDQGLLAVYYLYHPNEFKLDYSCDLFLCLHAVENTEIAIDRENKNVRCLVTETLPCVVHGNGGGKPLYQEIYNRIFLENPK